MPETYGELKTRCCQLRDKLAAALAERDAAVADLTQFAAEYRFTCEVCAHQRGADANPCYYPRDVDVDDRMCRACDRCPCGHCDGVSQWSWRGQRSEGSRI